MPFARHPHGGDDDQALGGDLGSDNAMVEDAATKPPPQKKAKSSFTSSSSSSPRAEEPAGEAAAAQDEKFRDLFAKYGYNFTSSSSPPAEEPAGEAAAAPWTAPEDEKLRDLVAKYGTDMWARESGFFVVFSAQMAEELPGRNRRQCRERWINVLDPTISKEPWSEDEDRFILNCFRDFFQKVNVAIDQRELFCRGLPVSRLTLDSFSIW